MQSMNEKLEEAGEKKLDLYVEYLKAFFKLELAIEKEKENG